MKKHTYLILIGLLYFLTKGFAQEVHQLKDNEVAGKGKLSDLAWLTGNWKGTGLGGNCDELWLPAVDSSMQGIFRFYDNGKLAFTEYMNIIQEDSSLTIKLKHYNSDLSPWEEKEKWVTFRLIKIEKQTAYFNGLTYQRKKNKLIIKLNFHNKEKTWIETFIFNKSKL
jgi:hypothetical protein